MLFWLTASRCRSNPSPSSSSSESILASAAVNSDPQSGLLRAGAKLPPALFASIAKVEAACFERPWGEAGIAATLAQDGVALTYLPISGVADSVAAYCLFQQIADEAEILQLATAPEHRRQGLGRQVLSSVLRDAKAAGANAMFLEVRRSNTAAVRLYESLGFQVVGMRRGYYMNAKSTKEGCPQEDALLLRCDLQTR